MSWRSNLKHPTNELCSNNESNNVLKLKLVSSRFIPSTTIYGLSCLKYGNYEMRNQSETERILYGYYEASQVDRAIMAKPKLLKRTCNETKLVSLFLLVTKLLLELTVAYAAALFSSTGKLLALIVSITNPSEAMRALCILSEVTSILLAEVVASTLDTIMWQRVRKEDSQCSPCWAQALVWVYLSYLNSWDGKASSSSFCSNYIGLQTFFVMS